MVRAGYGWEESLEPTVAPLDGASPAARALRSAGSVLIEHTLETADDRGDLLRSHGVASSAAVVVGAGLEQPFGVLSAHSKRAGAFQESDLFFLGGVAHVLAAALTRARSLEAVNRLAAIVESSTDAIVGRTLDGTVTTWNSAAERIFGYSAAEAVGRHVSFLLPPERKCDVELASAQIEAGESIPPSKTTLLHKDGSALTIEVTASPVTGEDGTVVGVCSVGRDLTERVRTEAAARQSDDRARAIIDATLDAVVTVDHTGAILEFNGVAERMFGYRSHDVIGRTLSECLVPPSLRERHIRGFERAVATGDGALLGKRVELVGLRRDGTEFPIELSINRVALEGPPVFTGFIRDLTEHKQSEQTRLQLATIVESSADAIIGKTLDGVVTSWNAAAERIYGYSAEEAIGRPIDFIVPPERRGEVASLLDRLRQGEQIASFETTRLHKDGTRGDLALTLSPIRDAAGRPGASSVIAHDITERKRAEAKLSRSETRYRELFDNASDLIAVVDLDSRLVEVN